MCAYTLLIAHLYLWIEEAVCIIIPLLVLHYHVFACQYRNT